MREERNGASGQDPSRIGDVGFSAPATFSPLLRSQRELATIRSLRIRAICFILGVEER